MKRLLDSDHREKIAWWAMGAGITFALWQSHIQASDLQAQGKGLRAVVMRIQREGVERRDQACLVFERRYLDEVRQLDGTYKYLVRLTPPERTSTLNRFVISELPHQEVQVRRDMAPQFCDERGVGLPEPNPRVPERPAAIHLSRSRKTE